MKPVLRIIPVLFVIGLGLSLMSYRSARRGIADEQPPELLAVSADPEVAGTVRVLAGINFPQSNCSLTSGNAPCMLEIKDSQRLEVYESRDYGQHWEKQAIIIDTDETGGTLLRYFGRRPESWHRINSNSTGALTYGSSLGQSPVFWQPPLAYHMYVSAFADNSVSYRTWFAQFFVVYSPSWGGDMPNSISKADPSVLYALINPDGLLIGPNPISPDNEKTIPYHIVRDGLPINPALKAEIDNGISPLYLMFALACLLIIPPLPYLNGWLLMQVFRYAFQPGEDRELRRYTWLVTGIATLGYLFPLTLALTREDVNFKVAVAGLGLINVIAGVAGAVWISRQRDFSDRFTRRMALASGLLSLAVPIGLGLGPFSWIGVMLVWCAFVGCRAALTQFLEREGTDGAQWGLDRMALEIPALFLFVAVPLGIGFSALLFFLMARFRVDSILIVFYPIFGLLATISIFVSVIIRYLKFRVGQGAWLVKKKSVQTGTADGLRRSDRTLYRKLFDYTLIWISGTLTVCMCLYFAILNAPVWFRLVMGF